MPAVTRPNILILMVDQLNGTLFPDGPARFPACAESRSACRAFGALRQCLHRLAALRARPRLLHVGAIALRTRVYDNAAEFASDIADLRPPPAPRGLPDRAFRQDAFRRPRPAARLRGTPDHRHLPRRFRLDAGLPQTGRADRLVVSQPRLRHRARAWPRSPTSWNTTTTSRFRPLQKLYDLSRGRRRAALVPDGQLHPPA